MRESFLVNRHLKELNPLQFGQEDCPPGHSFGPAIRKYTLIHYVRAGKGTFYKGGKAYPVSAGEAFIILPGEVTTYTADEREPWKYRWIGFDGELSEKFAELPPVVSVSDSCFDTFDQVLSHTGGVEYYLAGQLFHLLAELLQGAKHRNHYVRRVQDYIKISYMREIRVEQIAESLNVDRRYLSRIFKEKTGKTIQEYLISVRMEEACRLLSEGYRVNEAALLCGYPDVCNFSKMFKRTYSVSPAYYKKM